MKNLPANTTYIEADFTVEAIIETYFKNEFFHRLCFVNAESSVAEMIRNSFIPNASRIIIVETTIRSSDSDFSYPPRTTINNIQRNIALGDRTLELMFAICFKGGHYTCLVPNSSYTDFSIINDSPPSRAICKGTKSLNILFYFYGCFNNVGN